MKRYFYILTFLFAVSFLAGCQPEEPVDLTTEFQVSYTYPEDAVLYEPETGEDIQIPFTVQSDKGLPELKAKVVGIHGLAISIDLASDYSSGMITIRSTEKTSDKESFNIVMSCGTFTRTIPFTFEKARLNVYQTDLIFGSEASEKEIKVDTNVAVEVALDGDAKQFATLRKAGNRYFVSVTENKGLYDEKSGSLIISDAKHVFGQKTVTVTQASYEGSFLTDSLALVTALKKIKMYYSTGFEGEILLTEYESCLRSYGSDSPKKWAPLAVYSPEMDRIIGLNIFFNVTLNENIPEEIFDLKKLQSLSINNTSDIPLTGKIPQGIYNLKNLKHYSIGFALFEGKMEDLPGEDFPYLGKMYNDCGGDEIFMNFSSMGGFFEGEIQDWMIDKFNLRFMGISGRLPDKLVQVHNAERRHNRSNHGGGFEPDDDFIMYPFINNNIVLLGTDVNTVEIYYKFNFALWRDMEKPEGVVWKDGPVIGHYEWESHEAFINYMKAIGYEDIDQNLNKYPLAWGTTKVITTCRNYLGYDNPWKDYPEEQID